MTHRFSSLDGKIVETNAASLPAPGKAGSPKRSVFTTIRIKNGRPVFFAEHAARLAASARASQIEGTLDCEQLREHCAALISANEAADCGIRIVIYAGAQAVHEVLQTRDTGYDADRYANGFRLMTMRRDPPAGLAAGHKTLDHGASLDALAKVRANGFDEALFINTAGEAWECSVCNIFAVKDGVVRTPPEGSGVLPGIIRGRLLRGSTGFQIYEEPIPAAFLMEADEAFVTNSLLGIMPVSVIDDRIFQLRDRSATAALSAVLARWESAEIA